MTVTQVTFSVGGEAPSVTFVGQSDDVVRQARWDGKDEVRCPICLEWVLMVHPGALGRHQATKKCRNCGSLRRVERKGYLHASIVTLSRIRKLERPDLIETIEGRGGYAPEWLVRLLELPIPHLLRYAVKPFAKWALDNPEVRTGIEAAFRLGGRDAVVAMIRERYMRSTTEGCKLEFCSMNDKDYAISRPNNKITTRCRTMHGYKLPILESSGWAMCACLFLEDGWGQ